MSEIVARGWLPFYVHLEIGVTQFFQLLVLLVHLLDLVDIQQKLLIGVVWGFLHLEGVHISHHQTRPTGRDLDLAPGRRRRQVHSRVFLAHRSLKRLRLCNRQRSLRKQDVALGSSWLEGVIHHELHHWFHEMSLVVFEGAVARGLSGVGFLVLVDPHLRTVLYTRLVVRALAGGEGLDRDLRDLSLECGAIRALSCHGYGLSGERAASRVVGVVIRSLTDFLRAEERVGSVAAVILASYIRDSITGALSLLLLAGRKDMSALEYTWLIILLQQLAGRLLEELGRVSVEFMRVTGAASGLRVCMRLDEMGKGGVDNGVLFSILLKGGGVDGD